jgi:hypothetical protein
MRAEHPSSLSSLSQSDLKNTSQASLSLETWLIAQSASWATYL